MLSRDWKLLLVFSDISLNYCELELMLRRDDSTFDDVRTDVKQFTIEGLLEEVGGHGRTASKGEVFLIVHRKYDYIGRIIAESLITSHQLSSQ
jgi:hypothetical protein